MTDVSIDLRHAAIASLPDDPDSEVSSHEWNEQHVIAEGSITTEMLDSGVMTDVGTVWWNGHGAPTTVVGSKLGDYYLDLDTDLVYQLE